MSKVLILGATGSLGRHVTQQAIAANHEVSVVVRTPSRLPVEARERVVVHQADLATTSAAGSGGRGAGPRRRHQQRRPGDGRPRLRGSGRACGERPGVPGRDGSAGLLVSRRRGSARRRGRRSAGRSICRRWPRRTGPTAPTSSASGKPHSTGESCVPGRWWISRLWASPGCGYRSTGCRSSSRRAAGRCPRPSSCRCSPSAFPR